MWLYSKLSRMQHITFAKPVHVICSHFRNLNKLERILQLKYLLKLFIFIFIMSTVSACGFRPLYKKENFDQVRGKVAVVVTGQNRDETRGLSELLERELSYKAASQPKPYRLEVAIEKVVSEFAISRYSYSTRRKVSINVKFKIIDSESLKILDQGAFNSFSSFDLSQTSDYSNEIGVEFSSHNSIKILADQLVVRCAAVINKSELGSAN
jgi:hypothetical protein